MIAKYVKLTWRSWTMRETVHKFLAWAPPAFVGGLVTIATLGGESVRSAIWEAVVVTVNDPRLLLGMAAVVSAWTAGWLLTGRQPRPKSAAQRSGQLYLYVNAGRIEEAWTAYGAVWSPDEYFHLPFCDWDSWAGLPPSSPIERRVTFHLFNAGPSDARHVRVTWSLPDEDLPALIEQSHTFDDCVAELDATGLALSNKEAWIRKRFALNETKTIPVVATEATVPVEAPEGFNNAFAVAALSKARKSIDNPPPPPETDDIVDAVAYIDKQLVYGTFNVRVEFDIDGQAYFRDFSVAYLIRPLPSVRSGRRSSPGTDDSSVGAYGAWIDRVEIRNI